MRRIGIDFGTCYIKGAEKKKNGSVVHLKLGKAIDKPRIPNVIVYEQKEGGCRFFIGEAALKKPVSEQDKIRNIKTHLQEDGWKRELSFGKSVDTYEVTLNIMQSLYEEIHNTNKNEDISATITVPVNFSQRQQMIVEKAARESGFLVDSIITEPFAALFYLMEDEFEEGHNILIFDFGGGTLDLCVAEMKSAGGRLRIETQSTVGISYGGLNLNEDVLSHILQKRVPEQIEKALHGQENILREAVNRYFIMEALDTMKAELFEEEDAAEGQSADVIAKMFDGSLIDFGKVSVSDVYEMLDGQEWGKRLSRLLDKLFDDSDLIPAEITDVFVIGGTSSIPYFRDIIAGYFEKYGHEDTASLFELNDDMDREERLYASVAFGAAIYQELHEDEEIEIRDRIPFMVYTKDENGKVCSKLRKNDYFKDYASALAPVTEWMKKNRRIGVYQTIFGEDDKEVFLGYVPMDEEILAYATLYRLTVDKKRRIRMEFGYLLDGCEEDGFCRDWCQDLNIEI